MRILRVLILFLLLCLLPIAGSAFISGDVNISSNPDWAIAGGGPVTITVHVENASLSGNVAGATVTPTLFDGTLGTIMPVSGKTVSPTGNVTFTFTPKTTKGTADISFFVYYNESYQGTFSYQQKIDHANPSDWETIAYNSPLWVNTTTPIMVRLTDQYGNIVDNRRIIETITFTDSEDGDGGFLQGGNYKNNSITVPVQLDGNATVTYKVASYPSGPSVVQMIAPATVAPSSTWITIQGNATTPAGLQSLITSDSDMNTSSPHLALANNRDVFSIKYIVKDPFGNPVPNIDVRWTTSLGKNDTFTTNAYGYILIKYGPSTKIQLIDVAATVIKYPSLTVSDTLNFTSGGPTFMEVSASPQLIASRDVNENVVSNITAVIFDSAGRPVQGEVVIFEITNDINNTILVRYPNLTLPGSTTEEKVLTRTTDSEGRATVEYHPGEFPKYGETGFNRTSTGKSTITVTWDEYLPDDTIVTYKNYPYIATKASADPSIVEEGESINFTIRLIGDGYAFENPVDVVLLEDRADSMLLRVEKGFLENEDRMLHAQDAARVFLGMMEPGKDRVGIVSFGEKTTSANLYSVSQLKKLAGDDNREDDDIGYITKYYPKNNRSYSDYATIDLPLTKDFNTGKTANETLDEIVPFKNTFGGQPSAGFRYGIYTSITHILDSDPGSSKVKAVVGLLDTDYTWFGDPKVDPSGNPGADPFNMGGSTNRYYPFTDESGGYTGHWSLPNASADWQNMSNYAKDNGIRLYVVTYTPDVPQSRRVTISQMCDATGGFHIHAATPEELREAFRLIAEDIKSAAGEGAFMELDLSSINVTYEELGITKNDTFSGGDVFNYTRIVGRSTYVDSWNCTDPEDVPGSCERIMDDLPVPPFYASHYPYEWDHTQEWNNTTSLSFYVGNVTVDQVWKAKFTLKTNMSGSICIFGEHSQICFIDFEAQQSCNEVPEVCITVEKNLTLGPHYPGSLDIRDGSVDAAVASAISPDRIDVTWDMYYNGTYPVKQTGFYRYTPDNVSWSDWIQFGINNTGGRVFADYEGFGLPKFIQEMYGCYIFKVFSYEILGDGEVGATDEDEMKKDEAICINSTAKIRIR